MTDEEIEEYLEKRYKNSTKGYQISLACGIEADSKFEEYLDWLAYLRCYINRLKAENQQLSEENDRLQKLVKNME